MDQKILLLCKEKNTKILAILAEQNSEEITEFQTTVQMVQVVVNRLLSGKRQVVLDVALLDRIYVILGEYENILEQYVQSGRLRRLLGSNRLRRRLEKINSDLHVQLKLFVDSLKKLNTPQDAKGTGGEETTSGGGTKDEDKKPTTGKVGKDKKKKSNASSSSSSKTTPTKKPSTSKKRNDKTNTSTSTNNNGTSNKPLKGSKKTSKAKVAKDDKAGGTKDENADNKEEPEKPEATGQVDNNNKGNEQDKREGSGSVPTVNLTPTKSTTNIYDALPKVENERTSPKKNGNVVDNNDEGKGENGELKLSTSDMIKDEQGKIMWTKLFGEDNFFVEWDIFLQHLGQVLKTEITTDDAILLKHVLDNSGTGYVNMYKWSEFLKGFGPIPSIIANLRTTLFAPWFHGFLSSREAELLLEDQPVGTFLIRFSRSSGGSFALAFVQEPQKILHILIQSCMPAGFCIEEEEDDEAKTFGSLQTIVDNYHEYLTKPFTSDLPRESWFHGDLSAQEAQDVLGGHKEGTYLIRFSSRSGCFAASYVAENNEIKHALIQAVEGGYLFAGEEEIFTSLQHLLSAYVTTLQHPLPNVENNVACVLRKNVSAQAKGEKQVEADTHYGSVATYVMKKGN